MRPRFQFSLYKLFLVVAAYAAAFRMYSVAGPEWRALAVIEGTVLGLIIVVARKSELRAILVVAAFTFFGGLFFGAIIGASIFTFTHDYSPRRFGESPECEIWGVVLGGLFGGIIGMTTVRIFRSMSNQPSIPNLRQ